MLNYINGRFVIFTSTPLCFIFLTPCELRLLINDYLDIMSYINYKIRLLLELRTIRNLCMAPDLKCVRCFIFNNMIYIIIPKKCLFLKKVPNCET